MQKRFCERLWIRFLETRNEVWDMKAARFIAPKIAWHVTSAAQDSQHIRMKRSWGS
jgi:hypothetical protein